jgi:hypothetical protein
MKTSLQEYIETNELITMDGYDDCIAGIGSRSGSGEYVVYDTDKVLQKLMDDGMTENEAMEFHHYNQQDAWVGLNTPGFIVTMNSNR